MRLGIVAHMLRRSVGVLGLLCAAIGAVGCGGSTAKERLATQQAVLRTPPRTITVKPLHALGDKAAAPTEAARSKP